MFKWRFWFLSRQIYQRCETPGLTKQSFPDTTTNHVLLKLLSLPASNYANFIAGRHNKQARDCLDRWSSSSFRVKSCNPASFSPSWVQGSFSTFTFPTSQSLNWSWIRNSFLSRLILLDHSLPPRRPLQIFMILKRSNCALLPRKLNEILSFMNKGKRFSCLLWFFIGCYSHTVEGPWWGLQ